MSASLRVPYTPHFSPSDLHSPRLFSDALSLISLLKREGFLAYFVGGAVRDMLLKRPLKDIDIATDASVETLKCLFPKAILVGAQFGVIKVIKNGKEYELATLRKDSEYADGRHPLHVENTASYEEDAKRRDFTINGLFYDPEKQQILDSVGGIADLENKIIRTIGSPQERFSEDKLRVLRAVRFCHTLNFPIQDETKEAMRHFASQVPHVVSGERIWDELNKINALGKLPHALQTMQELGLFAALFPFTLTEQTFNQKCLILKELQPTILSAALSFLFSEHPQFPTFAKTAFCISNHDFSFMEQFLLLCKEFSLKPSEKAIVRLLALEHATPLLPYVAWCINTTPHIWLETIKKMQNTLIPWIKQLKTKQFIIMGKDLIEHGIAPGKEIGRLVEQAFDFSLQKKILEKKVLLDHVVHAKEPS